MSFKPKGRINESLYVHEKDPKIKYDDEVTACIDADLIAFKSAAKGEDRFILVSYGKEYDKLKFKTRSEFYGRDRNKSGDWLSEENTKRLSEGKDKLIPEDFTVVDDRSVEELSRVCHTVDVMIGSILDVCKTSTYKVISW